MGIPLVPVIPQSTPRESYWIWREGSQANQRTRVFISRDNTCKSRRKLVVNTPWAEKKQKRSEERPLQHPPCAWATLSTYIQYILGKRLALFKGATKRRSWNQSSRRGTSCSGRRVNEGFLYWERARMILRRSRKLTDLGSYFVRLPIEVFGRCDVLKTIYSWDDWHKNEWDCDEEKGFMKYPLCSRISLHTWKIFICFFRLRFPLHFTSCLRYKVKLFALYFQWDSLLSRTAAAA